MSENDKSRMMNGRVGSSGSLEERERMLERRGQQPQQDGGERHSAHNSHNAHNSHSAHSDLPDIVLEGTASNSKEESRKTAPMSRNHSAYRSGQETILAILQSWATKRFMSGCAILLPIAVTFYITWWFFTFVDGFFYPIYSNIFGINIIGLGFVTTFIFIFCVGVFVSSYVGSSIVWLGECIIKRVPLIAHIYSASKQISNAISPDQNVNAFKEVAIIRHPRIGEYAIAFITSSLTLMHENGIEEQLFSVYVPTNHVYIGDVFLVNPKEIIRPNLSVREGIEIVVSGGMSMPRVIRPMEPNAMSPSLRPLI